MATIKQYYRAVIKHQNATWQKMYDSAIETFAEVFPQGINQKIRKCAKAYTICYNAIHSGAYGLEIEDVCISDVETCVIDYFYYNRLYPSTEETRQTVYLIYSDLFPDSNVTFDEIIEFTSG